MYITLLIRYRYRQAERPGAIAAVITILHTVATTTGSYNLFFKYFAVR